MAQELKAYIAPTPDGTGLADYYLKSEADKVIAELKERLDTTEKLLNKALNGISNGNKHMMSLARKKNHADYKRCLAMAAYCYTNVHCIMGHRLCALADWKKEWFERWHKRWLELAEQFKEGV